MFLFKDVLISLALMLSTFEVGYGYYYGRQMDPEGMQPIQPLGPGGVQPIRPLGPGGIRRKKEYKLSLPEGRIQPLPEGRIEPLGPGGIQKIQPLGPGGIQNLESGNECCFRYAFCSRMTPCRFSIITCEEHDRLVANENRHGPLMGAAHGKHHRCPSDALDAHRILQGISNLLSFQFRSNNFIINFIFCTN